MFLSVKYFHCALLGVTFRQLNKKRPVSHPIKTFTYNYYSPYDEHCESIKCLTMYFIKQEVSQQSLYSGLQQAKVPELMFIGTALI